MNGYRYTNGHADSFGQIFDAAAIKMKEGQYISWNSFSDEMPQTLIDAKAPKGAVLIFEYAMGNGATYPQPNGWFELSIENQYHVRFSMKKHNSLFTGNNGIQLYLEIKRTRFSATPGEQFSLDSFIENESAYVNGLAYLHIPQECLGGHDRVKLKVTAHPQKGESSERWFRLGYGFYWLSGAIHETVHSLLHGFDRRTLDGQNIYFGDIHVHTAQSAVLNNDGCGIGTLYDNLSYAKDVSLLDFCAVTDHDWQLDAKGWKSVRDLNDLFNEPGRFVTLNAYEWTSSSYGHRNVYFRDGSEIPASLKPFNYQAEPFVFTKYGVRSESDPSPADLWQWLKKNNLPALTIPHHSNSEQFVMDLYHYFSEEYDRCVEIYSSWGTALKAEHALNICSEKIENYSIPRYSGKLHFGFVASSDGHDGNAGDANVSIYKRHLGHYMGSGRVAVLCDRLERNDIFDAIYSRRCYAVTGEPILLDMKMGDAFMGESFKYGAASVVLSVRAEGTQKLLSAELFANGEKQMDISTAGRSADFSGEIEIKPNTMYWIQIRQEDGEYAWSSPISVFGG
ncbi:MAG: DUF3604 domain-containing protein [Clostridiales bacterium]|nr:DUF3604 domain-containing protein [Clostridiales bacterium]